MSVWASKRKTAYLLVGTVLVLVAIATPVLLYVNRDPTCSDKIRNQGEEGVDCGGPCPELCRMGNEGLVVDWARVFRVDDGVYDMGALVENTNAVEGAREAIYQFKMYDEKNILIAERFGKTFVLPDNKWVVFEGNVDTGKREPRHAFIDFPEDIPWIRTDLQTVDVPDILVRDELYVEGSGIPRVTAKLVNKSPFAVRDIEAVAVLSDASGTAIGLSRTVITRLEKYETRDLVFTWREPFSVPPVKVDVIARANYMELYGVE
jgi:hypothetical protein